MRYASPAPWSAAGSHWAAAPSAPRSVTASPASQTIAAIARQPEIEAKARQYFFLTVGLVEAMYFINLLFMVVFVYVFAAKSIDVARPNSPSTSRGHSGN